MQTIIDINTDDAIKQHKIYDTRLCIIDEVFNVIYIPLLNKKHEIVKYTQADLHLKNLY